MACPTRVYACMSVYAQAATVRNYLNNLNCRSLMCLIPCLKLNTLSLSLSHVQSQVENEELREELSSVSAQYSSVLEENQRLRDKLENLEQVLKVKYKQLAGPIRLL